MANTRSNLSKETVKDILHSISGGLDDWGVRASQVVSPTYSIGTAKEQEKKIRDQFLNIGIQESDLKNNLIFLAASSTEKGKHRVVVDVNKLNNVLDNEKLGKLKDAIEGIMNKHSETLSSGEVGQGRGAYILEYYINNCQKVLDSLNQELGNRRPSYSGPK